MDRAKLGERTRPALLLLVVAGLFAAAGIYVCLLAHRWGIGFDLISTLLFVLICVGIAALVVAVAATIFWIARMTAVAKVVALIVLLLAELVIILWVVCWLRGAHAINAEWLYALPFLAAIVVAAVVALPSHRKAAK